MIGIVLVSHSAKLAEGVYELVSQMTQGQVPIAVAGGIEDPDNPIGTDPIKVQEAIESVYSDDGVVVLMDLGSALLSAEMALEFLTAEQRANIRLCEAPLVEGAMAAAVQATASSDIEAVLAEARTALAAKAAQLQLTMPDAPPTPTTPEVVITPENEIRLTIRNKLGLHARPAAQFVSTAGRFEAQMTVRNLTKSVGPVNAKSINQVATIGARQGHDIAVAAAGPDADEALAALRALVEANFGEDEGVLEPAAEPQPVVTIPLAEGELAGIPASPGIAIGPIARYELAPVEVTRHQIDDPEAEQQRLQAAIQAAKQEIQKLHRQAVAQVGDYEAAIFEAHLLFLDDPALVDPAFQRIANEKINAEAAWQAAVDQMVAAYRALEDPYLQARAVDVADVGQRVLKLLAGVVPASLELSAPSILIAADLTPSDTAQLNPDQVLGLCTELGSATSHSAILARALGIPAVVGAGPGLLRLNEGTTVALDGQQGRIWVTPDTDKLAELQQQREAWLAIQAAAKAASQQPAITQDGKQVEIVANIGRLADVKPALDNGAEGVGLLRTEFLYLDRITAPSEKEQLAAYQAIAEVLGTRPLIIRTLDIGGDKPLPYLDLGQEENPFLGERGVRIYPVFADLFRSQIRALLRASTAGDLWIMIPMIATVGDFLDTKAVIDEEAATLRSEGVELGSYKVGVMIEVPSAALLAARLAEHAEFFSIGTNDLTQYTMAADRTNGRLAQYSDPAHPAVLELCRLTALGASQHGVSVSVCGEAASDPMLAPVFAAMGITKLSVAAPRVNRVKAQIAAVDVDRANQAVSQAVGARDAEEVRRLVGSLDLLDM